LSVGSTVFIADFGSMEWLFHLPLIAIVLPAVYNVGPLYPEAFTACTVTCLAVADSYVRLQRLTFSYQRGIVL
jgi:hypothetical protein